MIVKSWMRRDRNLRFVRAQYEFLIILPYLSRNHIPNARNMEVAEEFVAAINTEQKNKKHKQHRKIRSNDLHGQIRSILSEIFGGT